MNKEVVLFSTTLPDLVAGGVDITQYFLDYIANVVSTKIGTIKELDVLNSILDIIPEV